MDMRQAVPVLIGNHDWRLNVGDAGKLWEECLGDSLESWPVVGFHQGFQ